MSAATGNGEYATAGSTAVELGHVPDANGVCVLCLCCADPACCDVGPCEGADE